MDIDEDVAPDSVNACQFMVQDVDAHAYVQQIGFGTSATDNTPAQWGGCKFSSTAVPAQPPVVRVMHYAGYPNPTPAPDTTPAINIYTCRAYYECHVPGSGTLIGYSYQGINSQVIDSSLSFSCDRISDGDCSGTWGNHIQSNVPAPVIPPSLSPSQQQNIYTCKATYNCGAERGIRFIVPNWSDDITVAPAGNAFTCTRQTNYVCQPSWEQGRLLH